MKPASALDPDNEMASFIEFLVPECVITSTDEALAHKRFYDMVRTNTDPLQTVKAGLSSQSASNQMLMVERVVDLQTAVVFIVADALVERALMTLSLRHEMNSCLLPTLLKDVSALVEEILLSIIKQYPSAFMFCVVDDVRTTRDENDKSDSRWADLYLSDPYHPHLFGYQLHSTQSDGPMMCWRDSLLRLYNLSAILGRSLSWLEYDLKALGRELTVVFAFPLIGVGFRDGKSNFNVIKVDANGGDCIKERLKITDLYKENMLAQAVACRKKMFEGEATISGGIVFELLWNLAPVAPLFLSLDFLFSSKFIYPSSTSGYDACVEKVIVKTRNLDGSLSRMFDANSIHEARQDILNSIAFYRAETKNAAPSCVNTLEWLRKIKENKLWESKRTAGFEEELRKIGEEVDFRNTDLVADNYTSLPPFSAMRSSKFLDVSPEEETRHRSISDLVRMGPKLAFVCKAAVYDEDKQALVRGTSIPVDQVNNYLLAEYALCNKLAVNDSIEINTFPGADDVCYGGSFWLLDCRDVSYDREVLESLYDACSIRKDQRNMFTDSFRIEPSRVEDVYSKYIVRNSEDEYFAKKKIVRFYNTAYKKIFDGILSPSTHVCAYGCGRLYLDAGEDLWNKLIRGYLALFRKTVTAAFMATMNFSIIVDAICHQNVNLPLSSIVSRNAPNQQVVLGRRKLLQFKRFHTWVFAAINLDKALLSDLHEKRDLFTLKTALLRTERYVGILTESIPIVEGVTVSLARNSNNKLQIYVFFDAWSSDAISTYISVMALKKSNGQAQAVDTNGVKINIDDSMVPVKFMNLDRLIV